MKIIEIRMLLYSIFIEQSIKWVEFVAWKKLV